LIVIKLSNKHIDEVSRKIVSDAVNFLCQNPKYINLDDIINTLCSISDVKLVTRICINKSKYLSKMLKGIDNIDLLSSEMNSIVSNSISRKNEIVNDKLTNILNREESPEEMKKEYNKCLTILFNILNEFNNFVKNDGKTTSTTNDETKLPEYITILLSNIPLEEIDSFIDIIIEEILLESENYLHTLLFNYFLNHKLHDKLIKSNSPFVEEFIQKIYSKFPSPLKLELLFKYYHFINEKDKAYKYLIQLCDFRTDSMHFIDNENFFKVSDLLHYFHVALNYTSEFLKRDNLTESDIQNYKDNNKKLLFLRDEYTLQMNIYETLIKKVNFVQNKELKKKILYDISILDKERFSWIYLYKEIAEYYRLYENMIDIILFSKRRGQTDLNVFI